MNHSLVKGVQTILETELFGTFTSAEEVEIARTLGYLFRTGQGGGHWVAMVKTKSNELLLCDSLRYEPVAVTQQDAADLLRAMQDRRRAVQPEVQPSDADGHQKHFQVCAEWYAQRVFLRK